MLLLITCILLALHISGQTYTYDAASNVGLNTVQLIKKSGYPCETHRITTEDGYILTYHRIPNDKKPAVLVMHGFLSSSADFVNMGTNRSLAYILADSGYDVWLGNCRGNFWSRKHKTLHVKRDAQKFFDFSWHEMGYYDLPAAIDYISTLKKNDSLYYVGHSQGGTIFLVMASSRPEYNNKIRLASLLAPSTFMENFDNQFVLPYAKDTYALVEFTNRAKVYEIPLTTSLRRYFTGYCQQPSNVNICRYFMELLVGSDREQIENEMMPVILTNAPSNAAIKQLSHFGQQVVNGGFSFYDHGATKNMKVYGTLAPPQYNLSQISAPVAIYYSKNDILVFPKDVQKLVPRLPNVAKVYLVPLDLFTHVDYVFAKDINKLLYKEMVETMQNY